jgi:addiction module HigA family antidote
MGMYNPPHPGEFIREVYLEPLNISYRSVALKLKVSPSTFLRLINGTVPALCCLHPCAGQSFDIRC